MLVQVLKASNTVQSQTLVVVVLDQFFVRSSRIRVDLLSYESKTTDKQQQNYWIAEKNWTGSSKIFLYDRSLIYLDYSASDISLPSFSNSTRYLLTV